MKLPAGVEKLFSKFNRMSLRERALVSGAALVAILMIWSIAVMDPTTAKLRALQSEMASLQEALATGTQAAADAVASDVTTRVHAREQKLQKRLDEINVALASKSADLIAPERMVQVIQDVLSSQRAIKLITLQNKPVTALVEPAPVADGMAAEMTGPYVHRVELIIEGSYLDIVRYLKSLEALPWRFHWLSLELQTTSYPLNRVRIELSTLSLDKQWIGV